MPLRSKKDLNSPPSGPVSINHSMSTVNKYKMNLLFHGQSKTSLNQNSSSVMKIVEKKLKNIEKMDKKKINDCYYIFYFSNTNYESRKVIY